MGSICVANCTCTSKLQMHTISDTRKLQNAWRQNVPSPSPIHPQSISQLAYLIRHLNYHWRSRLLYRFIYSVLSYSYCAVQWACYKRYTHDYYDRAPFTM